MSYNIAHRYSFPDVDIPEIIVFGSRAKHNIFYRHVLAENVLTLSEYNIQGILNVTLYDQEQRELEIVKCTI